MLLVDMGLLSAPGSHPDVLGSCSSRKRAVSFFKVNRRISFIVFDLIKSQVGQELSPLDEVKVN